ncbi:Vacuolar protein sorting-associated protein 26A [Tritrichomonas foetus]|uniref:Vacuolar protein sorting-associated protein 26A n=1 Tax=Tritrichomonas foetus TaxID=1144522 RepID=A0A1J4JK01_9EUKA|nr:Vacuolar protein sorting-associated protein 26A [Tritrichomonas foetus]|eukprot:OHS97885.1 Vacuolar protein sorting-associated protein 26A [Tritrichomonas foetus]
MPKEGPLRFTFEIPRSSKHDVPGVYQCGETVKPKLKITCIKEKSFAHRGVEFEFFTEIAIKGQKPTVFNYIHRKFSDNATIHSFVEFDNVPECQLDANLATYHGGSFSIKHILKVSVKKLIGSIDYEKEIIAYDLQPPIKSLEPLCVRAAVAGSIRIDLMINRRRYDLGDVIHGAAHFLLSELKIKCFNIGLVAHEYTEANGRSHRHKFNICNYEISDGPPVKGEVIPFRIFLDPHKLTPSCSNPTRGYSVTHFLNFMIITMTNEKYFKSLQIKLVKCQKPPFQFVNENKMEMPEPSREEDFEIDEGNDANDDDDDDDNDSDE